MPDLFPNYGDDNPPPVPPANIRYYEADSSTPLQIPNQNLSIESFLKIENTPISHVIYVRFLKPFYSINGTRIFFHHRGDNVPQLSYNNRTYITVYSNVIPHPAGAGVVDYLEPDPDNNPLEQQFTLISLTPITFNQYISGNLGPDFHP